MKALRLTIFLIAGATIGGCMTDRSEATRAPVPLNQIDKPSKSVLDPNTPASAQAALKNAVPMPAGGGK